MNKLTKIKSAQTTAKKIAMIAALGVSGMTLSGCSLGIDDFVTGITSNLCVFEGTCNGGVRM
jgi:hypothetical protein